MLFGFKCEVPAFVEKHCALFKYSALRCGGGRSSREGSNGPSAKILLGTGTLRPTKNLQYV